MGGSRFDALTRSFNPEPATRRRALRLLLGAIAGGAGVASAAEATARHRKRKHKSRCKGERRCSKKCCPKGKVCAGGVCVIGQGACPTGVHSCDGGATYVCGGAGPLPCACLETTAGDTRCVQLVNNQVCGECMTNDDCADRGPGAVCVLGGVNCCSSGQNFCLAPCLVGSASVKRMPAGSVSLLPH